MFREAFNKISKTGSNLSFGVTEDSKLYFDLSTPSPTNNEFKIVILAIQNLNNMSELSDFFT